MNDLFNKFLQENNLVVIEKDKEIDESTRDSPKYREWRKQVLERDGHKCQCCGGDKHLVAHHIFNYKDYPLLRCSVDNGITLCKWCHGKYHSYYGKKANAHTLMEYYKRFECNEISRVEKEPKEPVPVLDTPETRFLKEYYVEDVRRTHWLSNKEICDKYQEYCAQNHIPINQKSMMANMGMAISKVFGNIKHRKSKGMRYPLKLKEVGQTHNLEENEVIPKQEKPQIDSQKIALFEDLVEELYAEKQFNNGGRIFHKDHLINDLIAFKGMVDSPELRYSVDYFLNVLEDYKYIIKLDNGAYQLKENAVEWCVHDCGLPIPSKQNVLSAIVKLYGQTDTAVSSIDVILYLAKKGIWGTDFAHDGYWELVWKVCKELLRVGAIYEKPSEYGGDYIPTYPNQNIRIRLPDEDCEEYVSEKMRFEV